MQILNNKVLKGRTSSFPLWIFYHTKGCLDQGCSKQEILEAVAVTAAFGGGIHEPRDCSCSGMYSIQSIGAIITASLPIANI